MRSRTMAGKTPVSLFAFLVTLAILVMVSGCTERNPPALTISPTPALLTTSAESPIVTPAPSSAPGCTMDEDCVPSECCHPTSCINKAEKDVCTLMCTMSCEGPIDCGAGHCECVKGKCDVISSSTSK